MQYGVDIPTYKRVEDDVKTKVFKEHIGGIELMLIIMMGIMISRVNLNFSEELRIAPFGIAYLLSMIKKGEERKSISSYISVIIGYLSIYKNVADFYIYPIIATEVFLIAMLSFKINKRVTVEKLFVLILISFVGVSIIFSTQSVQSSILFSGVKALFIIPVFYVMNNGISSLKEIGNNYYFSTEELISMNIILCLAVAGIGELTPLNIDVKNIIAMSIVITIAYAGGANVGAVIGITMGLIVGITNDIILVTTLYGICGLIVGVFKDTGKLLSILSYIVACVLVNIYLNNINYAMIIEVLLSGAILLVIPSKFIKSILLEVSNEEKQKVENKIKIDGIKSEFIDRVEDLKSVLATMSTAILNLSQNDKLLMKNKGTALVERLADRVCSNCEMNCKCWEKEINATYSDFGKLIYNFENNKIVLPENLNKKCIKSNTLLKTTDDLFNAYTANEVVKKRLEEGRKLIASQINNMSLSINGVLREFEKDVSNCFEIDGLLRRTLVKNRIQYKEIYSYTDNSGRLKIKMKMNNCDGGNYCIKKVLPIISSLIRMPLCLSDEGCKIDPSTNECSVIIEETPKYHVSSYVSFMVKDGEKYSGDSFNFGKNNSGLYVTSISDGMGSGPEAGVESSITIDLVEKFMEKGFDFSSTLNVINSIMSMKFNEDEKFTTLDMNTIDLYTGDISFVKVGGTVSFVKSGKKVQVINENNILPLGALEGVNYKIIKKKLKHGDVIITLSDGVIDVDKNNVGGYTWLEKYLQGCNSNPEFLARDILEKAKSLSGGRVLDDMTVVVSKIYAVY